MRRRLALACAIVAQPQLLLLDEPTVGLDPEQRSGLRDLIHAIAKDCAVVFSTHELGEVDFFDPAVAVIDQGLMVFTGTAQQLRAGALEDASPAVRLESVCCLRHRRGRGRSGSGYGPGAALGGARESLIGPDVFGFGLRLAGPCQNTR